MQNPFTSSRPPYNRAMPNQLQSQLGRRRARRSLSRLCHSERPTTHTPVCSDHPVEKARNMLHHHVNPAAYPRAIRTATMLAKLALIAACLAQAEGSPVIQARQLQQVCDCPILEAYVPGWTDADFDTDNGAGAKTALLPIASTAADAVWNGWTPTTTHQNLPDGII